MLQYIAKHNNIKHGIINKFIIIIKIYLKGFIISGIFCFLQIIFIKINAIEIVVNCQLFKISFIASYIQNCFIFSDFFSDQVMRSVRSIIKIIFHICSFKLGHPSL